MTANLFARSNNNTDLFRQSNSTNNIFNGNGANRTGQQNSTWQTAGTSTTSSPFGQGNTVTVTGNSNPTYIQPTQNTSLNQIGSLRAPKYDHSKWSCITTGTVGTSTTTNSTNPYHNKTWTDKNYPGSIASVESTGYLSPLELRIEDYYLLRTNNVPDTVRSNIHNAINKNKSFNPDLLSVAPMPPVTAGLCYVVPTNSTGLSNRNGSSYQPNYGQPVGFNQTTPVSNIFNNNTNPFNGNSSNNPFGSNNNTNAMRTSNTGNNVFNGGQTPTNPFQNSGTNTANIFAQQIGGTQQSTYNNPFGQNSNSYGQQNRNNSNNNLFANTNTNANTNNNSNNNNNNLFANNTGSNLYANQQQPTNNIFAGNGTNSTSNNLFANSGQPTNIFANGGTANGYSTPNLFQQSLQHSQVVGTNMLNGSSYYPHNSQAH
ncbi:unnamed protein product [Sphagnum balticum]